MATKVAYVVRFVKPPFLLFSTIFATLVAVLCGGGNSMGRKSKRNSMPEPDAKMTLGKKIYELRKLRRWKQADLAKRSGVPRGHISRIENNDYQTWHLDTIVKLAKGFEIHPHVLLTATGLFNGLFDSELGLVNFQALAGEPSLQVFFAQDWPEMSKSEKEIIHLTIRAMKEAKDKRLNKTS